MNKANLERNKELVLKRKRNPKKWTFRALSEFFRLDVKTVYTIWERDKRKFGGG